jgi:type IV secretion system protein VirB10
MNPLRRWLSRPGAPPETPSDISDAADLQRAEAAVSQAPTAQGRLQRTLALLMIGGLGIGMLTWYYSTAYSKVEAARTASKRTNTAKADAESTLPPIDFTKAQPATLSAAPVETLPAYRIGSILADSRFESAREPVESPPRSAYAPATNAPKTPEQLRDERLLAGDVFSRSHIADPGPVLDDGGNEPPADSTTPTVSTPLTTLLQSSPPQLARASVLPTQRLLLPKGAFVDCTLETSIDSTLPGLAICLTAVDTFSADGSVVLLERGTKLIGETRGEVAHGASRLFVLWTEARTPQGVVVPLASPGTDELGRSGLPGKVDRHFMERFGAAILVSLIDGAIQVAVANQSGPGSTVVSTGTTQDIMTEVLKSTINIPPTLTKQQGDRIQILVARDLDFRSVYTLASRQR